MEPEKRENINYAILPEDARQAERVDGFLRCGHCGVAALLGSYPVFEEIPEVFACPQPECGKPNYILPNPALPDAPAR